MQSMILNIVFFHISYESHAYFFGNYDISLYMPRPFASYARINNVVVKIATFLRLLNVFVVNHHDAL